METFSASLAICAGNSSVTGGFPAHRPVTRSVGVFFDLRLNKRLSKQSLGWWFQTTSRSLWRHCDDPYSLPQNSSATRQSVHRRGRTIYCNGHNIVSTCILYTLNLALLIFDICKFRTNQNRETICFKFICNRLSYVNIFHQISLLDFKSCIRIGSK